MRALYVLSVMRMRRDQWRRLLIACIDCCYRMPLLLRSATAL